MTNVRRLRDVMQETRAQHTDWFSVRNAAPDSSGAQDEPTVYIYGVIGNDCFDPEAVPAGAFVRAFDAIEADRISVRINSPGGFVSEGIAIANSIRRHKAHVTVTVDGMAASSASFIALAGDELVMGRNAELMIHNPFFMALGTADEIRAAADRLDQVADNIASMYAAKAGGNIADWRTAMTAETWYSAEEAVAARLADRVDSDLKVDEKAKNQFDLSVFAHAGRKHAPPPIVPSGARAQSTQPSRPAEPAEPITPNQEGSDMSDTLNSGLRERLGIRAEAELDDEGLLAAVDEALAEQTEATPITPAGSVVLDEATYASLRSDAAAGRQARDEQLVVHRESVVQAAVRDGRIPPARASHWVDQLKADPGAEQVLAGLKPGLAVPLEASGFTGGVDEANDDDRFYAELFGDDSKGA